MTLSPDGLWWWNGTQWLSALSPDGRWRWDGSQWVLNAHQDVPVENRYLQVPTLETRPLQTAVLAYLVISAILGAYVSATTTATTLHGLPAYQSDTAAGQEALDRIVNAAVAGAILGGIAWNALLAVGTILRWRWTYYVVMVIGLLSIFGALLNAVRIVQNSQSDTAAASFIGVLTGLAYFGIAIWMLRLRRERGTAWAMQYLRVQA